MCSTTLGMVGLVGLMAESMSTACVLLDCMPDREPRILYVNPAFTRMTGYTREEAQGIAAWDLSRDRTEMTVLHRISSAMRRYLPVRGVTTTARKSGEAYMCELAVRPLHDGSGRVSHYLVFEREVRRRRGRPAQGGRRFEPVAAGEAAEDRFFAID